MGTFSHQQQSLETVIALCKEEAAESRESEIGHCFELFRRALDQNNDTAWEAIQTQYDSLIRHWIHAKNDGSFDAPTIDDLLQTTFIRFWQTLTRHEHRVEERFEHVGAILKYLNRCAVTAVLEWHRKKQRAQRLEERLQQAWTDPVFSEAIDTQRQQQDSNQMLALIENWVNDEVTDEAEQLIFTLSYGQNLKPAAIAKQHPNHFATTEDVYRVKRRLLKRAKRALLPQAKNLD